MNQKIAVITGTSSGIGKAVASLLLADGWKVYGISRRGTGDSGIIHLAADVSSREQVRTAFSQIGGQEDYIDLLVNNAGGGIAGAIEFTTAEEAQSQFAVTFFGAHNCICEALPLLRKSESGQIINMSSVAAEFAIPFQGFYSAAKAAVNAMTLALANELRPWGIRVSAVMPGDVRTGFTAGRKTSFTGGEYYGETIRASVAVMEHDEQTGMPPEAVARVICKVANKKNPAPLYTAGGKYKAFLQLPRILTKRAVNAIVGSMYRGK